MVSVKIPATKVHVRLVNENKSVDAEGKVSVANLATAVTVIRKGKVYTFSGMGRGMEGSYLVYEQRGSAYEITEF